MLLHENYIYTWLQYQNIALHWCYRNGSMIVDIDITKHFSETTLITICIINRYHGIFLSMIWYIKSEWLLLHSHQFSYKLDILQIWRRKSRYKFCKFLTNFPIINPLSYEFVVVIARNIIRIHRLPQVTLTTL